MDSSGMQLGDLGIAKLAKTEGVAAKTQIGEAMYGPAAIHPRAHLWPSRMLQH